MLENITKEKEITFEVLNYDKVSLSKLCSQLEAKLKTAIPVPVRAAVSVQVTYALNGPAWRASKFAKASWHLAAPSANGLLEEIGEVLTRSGYCTAGQVAACAGVKYPARDKINRLTIIVTQISPPLKADKPRFESKFLDWYLNLCEEKSKEPSYKEFNRNLKKLRAAKLSKKEKDADIFADIIKNYKDSKIME